MQIWEGIAASPGAAIGEALVADHEGFRIPRRFVLRDAVDEELARLGQAIEQAGGRIEASRNAITEELGDHYGAIFGAHLEMLRDPQLSSELEQLVRQRQYSPEYAVATVFRRYAKAFEALDNPYLSEKAHDIFDLEKSLLGALMGRPRAELSHLVSPAVVLAHNLTPSETAHLDRRFVRAFALETGGRGGHTAIVAQALEIPAVVGVGKFLTEVSGGDQVIVDGDHGLVILDPDERTLDRYRQKNEQRVIRTKQLAQFYDLPAVTRDGVEVELCANIEFPHEAEPALARGADGIGLYRTEFLYLGADYANLTRLPAEIDAKSHGGQPSEQTHYQAYSEVLRSMSGRPVVIRTVDLGADKVAGPAAVFSESSPLAESPKNPCLGLRSIRWSLRNQAAFRTQLRAILRASVLGDVRIMFPLITTVSEVQQAKAILRDVQEELAAEQTPFNPNMPIGIMVETPAAVVMLDRLAAEADFFSIGANDLIQYALAVDRGDPLVADLYQAADPAVLRLMQGAIQTAEQTETPVSACGQMCGQPRYTMLLLGLGLRRLSAAPSAIPEVKRVCRSVTIDQCQRIAHQTLQLSSAADIESLLQCELEAACDPSVVSLPEEPQAIGFHNENVNEIIYENNK